MAEDLLPEQRRALDYLKRKGTQASIEVLREQTREAFASVERSFAGVAAHERVMAPAGGKWSPHEILDHLVLSHGPAVSQLASLLEGVSPGDLAIPADLHRAPHERPEWDVSLSQLAAIHQELLALLDAASGEHSLEPTAVVEMVVKIGSERRCWHERLDWKAFVQGIRVHTLEHENQLRKTLEITRAG
jgi:hypothetical protein